MVEHGADLGIHLFVQQVLELACLGLGAVAADIEHIHHEAFGKPMTPHGPFPLLLALGSQADLPPLYLDVGKGGQLPVRRIVGRDGDCFHIEMWLPLLLTGYPEGFENLFRFIG
jgi:hypothetical protein